MRRWSPSQHHHSALKEMISALCAARIGIRLDGEVPRLGFNVVQGLVVHQLSYTSVLNKICSHGPVQEGQRLA